MTLRPSLRRYHDVGWHMGPFDQLSSYDVVSMSFPGNGFMEVEQAATGTTSCSRRS